MESIESIWSDLQLDSEPNFCSFNWSFQMDPNHLILQTHKEIARHYFGFGALEVAMRDVEVIETPRVLFQRHLATFPIDETKVHDLARMRSGETDRTTVFEDPLTFYKYNTLGLIIAEKPTDCYTVTVTSENDLVATHEGLKWAIFKIIGHNTYHFETHKWARVPII